MYELPEDYIEIRDWAREFARSRILPGAHARDVAHTGADVSALLAGYEKALSEGLSSKDAMVRAHAGAKAPSTFAWDLVREMSEYQFMGMFAPEEYGGMGLDYLSYVVALEEVSYADAGVGVVMSVNNSLAGWPILKFGTEAQKQKYLTPIASGEKVGCYALTEPNAGSDAGAQRTRTTKREDGGYVLDGTKMWITNGPQAEICVTYANLDPDQKHRTVCAFIVENTFAGYKVGKVEEKLGIACSDTSELVFDGMQVPADNLLYEEGKGFNVAMATLDGGRIGIAAQALGIAQRAFDLAVSYAKEREAFGKPISSKQAIQWMIADMGTRIEAARLLTYRAASRKWEEDQASTGHRASTATTRACSMAKLFASETANFCADRALQIHGGYGYSKEYEVERLFRDARITTLYEGTSEIQRLVIAKSFLG
ncbi:MAG: acyl-CoA dehydrogenase family protein [Myxococcota bacterium]|nr:acyl-CoA dehydrogenase family protein [Myxococcota bacterium]